MVYLNLCSCAIVFDIQQRKPFHALLSTENKSFVHKLDLGKCSFPYGNTIGFYNQEIQIIINCLFGVTKVGAIWAQQDDLTTPSSTYVDYLAPEQDRYVHNPRYYSMNGSSNI